MSLPFDPTQLSLLDLRLAEAWRVAAGELGLEVTAPFELSVGGDVLRYGALVVGFGTRAGLVLRAGTEEWHPGQVGAIWTEAMKAGYFPANVAPLLCSYDRDEFVSFLNILDWCGPSAERPAWYTGPVGNPRS